MIDTHGRRYRIYRRLRREGYRASTAHYAISEPRYPVPNVTDYFGGYDTPTTIPVVVDGRTFNVQVLADDEPYDWGDIEPTEAERDALEVYGVIVTDDLGNEESLWGIGVVSLSDTQDVLGYRYVQDCMCDLIYCLLGRPHPAPLLLGI